MPLTEKTDTKRLSEIESSLDSAFEGELHLESISQGAAREALLDVTELLLIGQGRQIDEDSGAMSSYTNNLTKSASSVLRQIERFAPVEQFPFLDSWNSTIRQCISTCSFFAVVEDAFLTCWKGYSTARIDGQNVTFEPLGSILDARLRFFRAYDDFEDDSEEQFDMKLLTAPDVMEGVARSIMATEFKKMGGFEYVIELPVVLRFADEYERVFTVPLRGALEIDLGLFTARDLLRAWCRLLSLARLHWMVRLLTSDAPNLPQTSLVFPALYRKKQFWLDALSGLPQPEKLLSVLTFDPVEKAGDICVTPLVRIQEGYFGLVLSAHFTPMFQETY